MELLAASVLEIWSQWLWPIAQFVIMLGLVVFVHELGHFIAAKWAGIKVEEFALGFGRRLISRKRGETEYRLNLLPLGGYVKMLGQDDLRPSATAEHDPRSWQATAPRKRMIVLAAGVTMNVIFAVLVFVLVYMVGIRFPAPVVGGVTPGYPAATVALPADVAKAMAASQPAVGLAGGDRIVSLDGKKLRNFRQIMMESILSKEGQVFDMEIARPTAKGDIDFHVQIGTKTVQTAHGPQRVFGIQMPATNVIGEPGKEGYAGGERFAKKDRVVEVAGRPVAAGWDIWPALAAAADQNIPVLVDRGGQRATVTLSPPVITDATDSKDMLFSVLGMHSRIKVVDVPKPRWPWSKPGPAAKAGLEAGDVIVAYAGTPNPSRRQFNEINKARVGQGVLITVLRDGKKVEMTVTPEQRGEDVLIGVAVQPEMDLAFVAEVAPDSPAAKAGVVMGAEVVAVNGKPATSWRQVFAQLARRGGERVELTVRQDGAEHKAEIGELTKADFDEKEYIVSSPAFGALEDLKSEPVRGDPIKAIAWSAEDTWEWVNSSYRTLSGIISGQISAKGVSGPVGIGQISIMTARQGVIEMAYLMAMLSAMLAVFNFLPFPVLDGGHFVLVVIEKVRGRPLPPKVVEGILKVGLVMILGLVLLVTFNDIVQIFK